MAGTVEIGAVFSPLGSGKWRWRMFIGGAWLKEGSAATEPAAKAALENAWANFLDRAGLQEAPRQPWQKSSATSEGG
jgi:hypothetical protein